MLKKKTTMGNCLNYPPKVEYDRQQKYKASSMKSTYLQGTNHTVLPFNSFNRKEGGYQVEDTSCDL